MGISGIGGGGTQLWSFQQLNRKVDSEGVQTASEISKKAGDYSRVSNFGTETKLRSSVFQQSNQRTIDIG